MLSLALATTTGFAVEVTLRGIVGAVNPTAATLTLNGQSNGRRITVAPTATITVNGKAARLNEIPAGSEAIIIADKDAGGNLLATQITVSRSGAGAPAANPLIEGTVVGIDPAAGTLTVRTAATDQRIVVGTAPVLMGNQRVPLVRVRIGDTVRVRRTIPPGGTEYITDRVWITSAPGGEGASGSAPGASAGQTGPDPGSTGVSLTPPPTGSTAEGASGTAVPPPTSVIPSPVIIPRTTSPNTGTNAPARPARRGRTPSRTPPKKVR
jgi:hypothetical protein